MAKEVVSIPYLAKELAKRDKTYSKIEMESILHNLVSLITKELKSGKIVRLNRLGKLNLSDLCRSTLAVGSFRKVTFQGADHLKGELRNEKDRQASPQTHK